MLWQERILARHPDFEPIRLPDDPRGSLWNITTYHLRPGRRAADVKFGEIGYARAALDSYRHFEPAIAAGHLPPDAKFQVSLPTAAAFIWFFVAEPAEQLRRAVALNDAWSRSCRAW